MSISDVERLLEQPDFDLNIVAARILGRDISRTASEETKLYVLDLLKKESSAGDRVRLVSDLLKYSSKTTNEDILLTLIDNILKGIEDTK